MKGRLSGGMLFVAVFLMSAMSLGVFPVGCGGAPQEKVTEPGGKDAGQADSGTKDAGAPTDQGGTNDTGGTPDRGVVDTGSPDTGAPVDQGTPDAGTPDKGAPDAGSPDKGTPDAGTPDAGAPDAGEPDKGTTSLSFANDIKPIFVKSSCSNDYCHGVSKSGGLDLRDPIANLVNKKSRSGKWVLVVPGDPAKSLLYEKISKATPAEGRRMPSTGQLKQSDIDLIRDWIQQGAKP